MLNSCICTSINSHSQLHYFMSIHVMCEQIFAALEPQSHCQGNTAHCLHILFNSSLWVRRGGVQRDLYTILHPAWSPDQSPGSDSSKYRRYSLFQSDPHRHMSVAALILGSWIVAQGLSFTLFGMSLESGSFESYCIICFCDENHTLIIWAISHNIKSVLLPRYFCHCILFPCT